MTSQIGPSKDLNVELMIKQYEALGSEIRTRMRTVEPIAAIVFTTFGPVLAIGQSDETRIAASAAFFGLSFYAFLIIGRMSYLGGFRKYLEERINDISRHRSLAWESQTKENIHHEVWTNSPVFLVWVATVAFSLLKVWRAANDYSGGQYWLIILFFVVLVALLPVSVVKMLQAPSLGYSAAKHKRVGEELP